MPTLHHDQALWTIDFGSDGVPYIVTELLEHGLPDDTPAATVANGTMPNQRIIRSALISIAHDVADAGIEPPAITVIGAVAGLPTRFWSGSSPVASG